MPKGLWDMWVAVLVSLFSYFSIEMIAIAAGEAEDPNRPIRQAFRATMLRLALFYLATLALVPGAEGPWHAEPQRFAGSSASVLDLRHRGGRSAECVVWRASVSADAFGVDLRAQVHMDDGVCDTPLLSPPLARPRMAFRMWDSRSPAFWVPC